MKVSIIGVGLIGGSFALAIKEAFPESTITGIDKSEEHLKEAVEIGFIDRAGTMEDLADSDVAIVAVPVDISIKVLSEALDHAGDDTLVIDAGSTKFKLCEAVKEHPKRRNYLSAHPIAGTEFSGPSAAIKDLYKEKTNIVCEVEKTAFKLQELGNKVS